MELEELKILAEKTREKFEKNEIPQDLIKKLYLKYNPISNVNNFLKQAKDLFPNLNCGIASLYLKQKIVVSYWQKYRR